MPKKKCLKQIFTCNCHGDMGSSVPMAKILKFYSLLVCSSGNSHGLKCLVTTSFNQKPVMSIHDFIFYSCILTSGQKSHWRQRGIKCENELFFTLFTRWCRSWLAAIRFFWWGWLWGGWLGILPWSQLLTEQNHISHYTCFNPKAF